MDLTTLRILLRQACSHDTCLEIIRETAVLYREEAPSRWFFLLLNRIFCQIVENPELISPETAEPVLSTILEHSLLGLDVLDNCELLTRTAWQLTEAYCGLP
jgi:hypothetical protein